MRTWWLRNRWALLALPLVLALTWAATSYRVLTMWNPFQLTDEVTAPAGEPVHLVQELSDAKGTFVVDVELTASPARQVSALTHPDNSTSFFPGEAGTVVWQVDLTVTADPGTVVTTCRVRLVDTRGRETTYSSVAPGVEVPFAPCVPEGTPGPLPALSPDEVPASDEPERPGTYTVPVVFRTADDFVPDRMDIWYEVPRYASLPVRPDLDGQE